MDRTEEQIIKKQYVIMILFIMSAVFFTVMMTGTVQAASSSIASNKKQTMKQYTASLYDSNGALSHQVKRNKGSFYTLPSKKNPNGKTFLGWALSKNTEVPDYAAGETIVVQNNTKLYPVYFENSKKILKKWGELIKLDLSKYKMVIFVGDSRTHRMGLRFNNDSSTQDMMEVVFIGQGGARLNWMKNTAYNKLIDTVNKCNRMDKSNRKIAVVFNLGVNDLSYKYRDVIDTDKITNSYASYFNSLGKTLEEKNCKLFYMTVNPTNCTMIEGRRKAEEINSFNILLKKKLTNNYRWINCKDYLARHGYSFDSGVEQESGRDDGVHYTEATYQSIYHYCIKKINQTLP